jgi:hypothetical protein
MAAPTTAARVKKALANPEPSTHGPKREVADWQLRGEVRTLARVRGSGNPIPCSQNGGHSAKLAVIVVDSVAASAAAVALWAAPRQAAL